MTVWSASIAGGHRCFAGIFFCSFILKLYAEQEKTLTNPFRFYRDVFPYGIYMLAYEYTSRALANSEWILEKRRQFKKIQKTSNKLTYIDVSIPILAGALAGNFDSNEKKNAFIFQHLEKKYKKNSTQLKFTFDCDFVLFVTVFLCVFWRAYVMDFGDSIRCHKNHRTSWGWLHQTW